VTQTRWLMGFGSLSIRARMLLAALLPATLIAVLLASVFLWARLADNEATHSQRARSLLRQVALASEFGLFSGNVLNLQSIAAGALKEADVRSVVITDVAGVVLAKAGQAGPLQLPLLSTGESGFRSRSGGADVFSQPIVAAAVALDDPVDAAPGVARAAAPTLGHVVLELNRNSLLARERKMIAVGIAITVAGLLFGGLLAAWMGRGVVRPIMRVSQMIKRIGNGELSVREPVRPDDPLRDVQVGLNQMVARLESGRDDMSRQIAAATLELREKKEEAELATQVKSQFLAAASHDLRQPTHALGMFVARLGQLSHDEQTQQLVGNIDASVHALQNLLDGLLDISKLDAGAVQVSLQTLALNDVLDPLRQAMQQSAADKGLRLRVRPNSRSHPVWLRSDPVLLSRILMNLVSNAIRYTETGAVLAACRAMPGASHARLEVWDSGIGIAPAHHEQVFKEFFQVSNPARDRSQGLGLGLNIVQRTAKLLNHRIEMRSSLGQGTRFTVWVPQALASAAPTFALGTERRMSNTLEGICVLVVEDDVLASVALVGLLDSWGCRVQAADSLAGALAQVKAHGAPDIIVSDYRLRGPTNGIDVIAALRAHVGKPLAACLASGDTDQQLIAQARDAGLTLLHKPVRPAKLRSLLRSLVAWPNQAEPNLPTPESAPASGTGPVRNLP
jgi:two-component system, sensor histidine kinase